uniref:Probable GPI-anchored adhesin-like protein PGA55-like n=1 Tax=Saccoglossus kowalevskii TaxID=10224 RepID=A0ABM0MR55_SACKO|nr:PREDICTED: probable GPI-anchored adhesin-like protein PGA55-like [Saccoglossus kowalevskii]
MNPLFSGPMGKSKQSSFYSNITHDPSQKQSSNAFSERRDGAPAPHKKPRISDQANELDPFDDFPEFTTDELEQVEAIELMASQKVQNSKTQELSVHVSDNKSKFAFKPVNTTIQDASSLNVGMSNPKQHARQSNLNFVSHGKIHQQTASATVTASISKPNIDIDSTVKNNVQSNISKYPVVRSSSFNCTAASMRSSSATTSAKQQMSESRNAVGHQTGQFSKLGGTAASALTPGSGFLAKDSHSLQVTQEGKASPSLLQELNAYKSECEKYKKQLSSLQEERYRKDGEIRLLRENLTTSNDELHKAQMEKIHQNEELKKEQKKKEKELDRQIENMKTQLQFKEMEIVEIQDKYKSLENKHRALTESSNSITPKNTPQISQGPYHLRTEQLKEGSPAKNKGDHFPTRKSFHAHTLPVTPPPKSPRFKPRTSAAASPSHVSSPSRRGSGDFHAQNRHTKLKQGRKINVNASRASCSSSQLVSKLLTLRNDTTYSIETGNSQGLITLLQLPVIMDHHASAEMDAEISPLTAARSPKSQSPGRWSPIRLTSVENHSKALQTMSLLLSRRSSDTPPKQLASCSNTSALGLLPVIQDHLIKYIDILHSVAEPTATTNSAYSSVNSTDSLRLAESENWAFIQTEKATLNSLRILHVMICNSCCIRTSLLKGSSDTICETHSSGHTQRTGSCNDTSVMEIDPSAPLIPDTQVATQSKSEYPTHKAEVLPTWSDCQLKQIPTNSILIKVLRIASIHNMYGQSGTMIEATLSVLLSLAENSQYILLDRLLPLLTDGTLQNCLSSDSSYTIVLTGLKLLNVIVSNRTVVFSLCNQSDSCTLLRLYQLCVNGVDGATEEQWIAVEKKILQFFCTVFSCHHGAVSLLVESDCDCSIELVKSIICMMYKEYAAYSRRTHKSDKETNNDR